MLSGPHSRLGTSSNKINGLTGVNGSVARPSAHPGAFLGALEDSRPIGIFDSGIGGLTVLRELMLRLPQESFIYLGDTARLPYGSKSPETIARYLEQNIAFLKFSGVKAVVVACNSASTALLGRHPDHYTIPVYNVIEPGARKAVTASLQGRIGVLGTKATVLAQSYPRCIHALLPTAFVIQQACPLLVPLVEEGWENDPLTNLIVYRYVHQVVVSGIDTLILGCTHYPVLRESIGRVAGQSITLVDSAAAVGEEIELDLQTGRLGRANCTDPSLQILTTDVSSSFTEVAHRLMAPHRIPELRVVDIGS
jgi:glutamate racemase